MDLAKTTARQGDKHLSFGDWAAYIRDLPVYDLIVTIMFTAVRILDTEG